MDYIEMALAISLVIVVISAVAIEILKVIN